MRGVGNGDAYPSRPVPPPREDPGNTDETAKFPMAVATIWRWSGDNAFRDEMYGYTKRNLQYIFGTLDADGDLWPEGLGNVERPGMGQEKLDVTIYTIRGLWTWPTWPAARAMRQPWRGPRSGRAPWSGA